MSRIDVDWTKAAFLVPAPETVDQQHRTRLHPKCFLWTPNQIWTNLDISAESPNESISEFIKREIIIIITWRDYNLCKLERHKNQRYVSF